jgi:hypothetical protein
MRTRREIVAELHALDRLPVADRYRWKREAEVLRELAKVERSARIVASGLRLVGQPPAVEAGRPWDARLTSDKGRLSEVSSRERAPRSVLDKWTADGLTARPSGWRMGVCPAPSFVPKPRSSSRSSS